MKTYAVFQTCDKTGLNRLVDRIVSRVQDGINFYHKAYRTSEVLFFPNCWNIYEDAPESLKFFEPDNVTAQDIQWLRDHQILYGNTSIPDKIQNDCDLGYLGLTRGICVHVKPDEEVFIKHKFIVELRHVYE